MEKSLKRKSKVWGFISFGRQSAVVAAGEHIFCHIGKVHVAGNARRLGRNPLPEFLYGLHFYLSSYGSLIKGRDIDIKSA